MCEKHGTDNGPLRRTDGVVADRARKHTKDKSEQARADNQPKRGDQETGDSGVVWRLLKQAIHTDCFYNGFAPLS